MKSEWEGGAMCARNGVLGGSPPIGYYERNV